MGGVYGRDPANIHHRALGTAGAGQWQRGGGRHENVLVDSTQVPALLAQHGVAAAVASSSGGERRPEGLEAVVGRRP